MGYLRTNIHSPKTEWKLQPKENPTEEYFGEPLSLLELLTAAWDAGSVTGLWVTQRHLHHQKPLQHWRWLLTVVLPSSPQLADSSIKVLFSSAIVCCLSSLWVEACRIPYITFQLCELLGPSVSPSSFALEKCFIVRKKLHNFLNSLHFVIKVREFQYFPFIMKW